MQKQIEDYELKRFKVKASTGWQQAQSFTSGVSVPGGTGIPDANGSQPSCALTTT